MPETFSVRVGEFEGPLPRLLELVEKRQLPISQVSLARVADDFLDYVRTLGQPPMAILAEFLVVASTLMLIKSVSLLPSLTLTEDESVEIGDLEHRLKLYQTIQTAALELRQRFGRQPIFYPETRPNRTVIFSPSREITLTNLLSAMNNLIALLPLGATALPRMTIKKIVSLEEMIKDLAARVQNALKMNFSDFIKNKTEKVNIIVGFLALLELCKQGLVEVEQGSHFDEITIETKTAATPHY